MPTTITTARSSPLMRENIKNNVEELQDGKIKYQNPFLSFESEKILTKRLVEYFTEENGISRRGNPPCGCCRMERNAACT